MECRKISDLIMKYMDKDISAIESEKLLGHIKSCSDCNMEFEVLKSALHSVEEMPDLDLSYGFETKVMQAIKVQQKEKSKLLGIGVVGLISLVCYIAAFFTLPLIRESGIIDVLAYYVSAGFAYALEQSMRGFVAAIIYIGKLFALRDLLMSQYMGIVNIALVVAMLNMIVFRSIKYQHD